LVSQGVIFRNDRGTPGVQVTCHEQFEPQSRYLRLGYAGSLFVSIWIAVPAGDVRNILIPFIQAIAKWFPFPNAFNAAEARTQRCIEQGHYTVGSHDIAFPSQGKQRSRQQSEQASTKSALRPIWSRR